MTVETLFGKEEVSIKSRTIRFRIIGPVLKMLSFLIDETSARKIEVTSMIKQEQQPPHAQRPCTYRFPQGECAEATIDNEGEWQFCADNELCVLERRKLKEMEAQDINEMLKDKLERLSHVINHTKER